MFQLHSCQKHWLCKFGYIHGEQGSHVCYRGIFWLPSNLQARFGLFCWEFRWSFDLYFFRVDSNLGETCYVNCLVGAFTQIHLFSVYLPNLLLKLCFGEYFLHVWLKSTSHIYQLIHPHLKWLYFYRINARRVKDQMAVDTYIYKSSNYLFKLCGY